MLLNCLIDQMTITNEAPIGFGCFLKIRGAGIGFELDLSEPHDGKISLLRTAQTKRDIRFSSFQRSVAYLPNNVEFQARMPLLKCN
ncbi:hypothetical protein ASC75_24695 [Aminobacter sp. DSM 101952]|nr:hypothetical protein ASC75_24695 [Aminobacter sp. DSM 101952]